MDALKMELLDMLRSMQEEGMVDHCFEIADKMKLQNGPCISMQLIPTFCTDAEATIRTINTVLDEAVADFYELEELYKKIKGATSCIGARRMALKCDELGKAIEDKSKEECIAAMEAIKHEFSTLKEKLNTVTELERRAFPSEAANP